MFLLQYQGFSECPPKAHTQHCHVDHSYVFTAGAILSASNCCSVCQKSSSISCFHFSDGCNLWLPSSFWCLFYQCLWGRIHCHSQKKRQTTVYFINANSGAEQTSTHRKCFHLPCHSLHYNTGDYYLSGFCESRSRCKLSWRTVCLPCPHGYPKWNHMECKTNALQRVWGRQASRFI